MDIVQKRYSLSDRDLAAMPYCRFLQLQRTALYYSSWETRERWRLVSWPAYWGWANVAPPDSDNHVMGFEEWWSHFWGHAYDKDKKPVTKKKKMSEMKAEAARTAAFMRGKPVDLFGPTLDNEKTSIKQTPPPQIIVSEAARAAGINTIEQPARQSTPTPYRKRRAIASPIN